MTPRESRCQSSGFSIRIGPPGSLEAISGRISRRELSAICQASAIGKYRLKKLSSPRTYRRRITGSGIACPPARTRAATRWTAMSALGNQTKVRWKKYPASRSASIRGRRLRLASVVSIAKSCRLRARSSNLPSIIRPASISPTSSDTAMSSAFTKAETAREPVNNLGAEVDFPAPFGPAMTKRLGISGLQPPRIAFPFQGGNAAIFRLSPAPCLTLRGKYCQAPQTFGAGRINPLASPNPMAW